MKYILVPQPVHLHNMHGEPMVDEDGQNAMMTFFDFFFGRLCDPQFGASSATVLIVSEIRKAVDTSDAVIALETEHWKLLAQVTENPSKPYRSDIAFNMLGFMDAITEAKNEPPPENHAPATPLEGLQAR